MNSEHSGDLKFYLPQNDFWELSLLSCIHGHCDSHSAKSINQSVNQLINQSKGTKDWFRDGVPHITMPFIVFPWTFGVQNWEKRTIMEAESYCWQLLSGPIHDFFLLRIRICSNSHIPWCLINQFLLWFREILMKTFK